MNPMMDVTNLQYTQSKEKLTEIMVRTTSLFSISPTPSLLFLSKLESPSISKRRKIGSKVWMIQILRFPRPSSFQERKTFFNKCDYISRLSPKTPLEAFRIVNACWAALACMTDQDLRAIDDRSSGKIATDVADPSYSQYMLEKQGYIPSIPKHLPDRIAAAMNLRHRLVVIGDVIRYKDRRTECLAEWTVTDCIHSEARGDLYMITRGNPPESKELTYEEMQHVMAHYNPDEE
ncbi:hypothetical protein JAAARDRAFT_210027 [Jaapia argillacea MUCL 33604]|uniref:Uncharacterized protein n=1 Tax=Jaapia argillacea MUCL 33604 TaxID=933084 RepID=A0A067PSP3_9AGAM|nr:hypothetical protein JAAARDRAFT_210027 [Jaapia argillacea MUCL 33604]